MVRCKKCKMDYAWLKNEICGSCNEEMKRKDFKKHWTPKSIKGKKMQEFSEWINSWADFNKHPECLDDLYTIGKGKKPNHVTKYGQGYNQAVNDIFRKLGLDYKYNAKRGDGGRDK